MENSWQKNLRKIDPYVPGEQSNYLEIIKLNANENPYPPSPKAIEAARKFAMDNLRFYPDANAFALKKALADYYGVCVENVFVGNGSDDVLALAFQAFFNSDLPIAFPDITYSFYPVWCNLFNIAYKTYPLDDDFRVRVKDYEEANGGVVLANPNAPTSLAEGKEFIKKLMSYNKDSIVIIDETYVDFGGYSSVELTAEYENLLITGTFSKSRSFAGLRIGFAIGSTKLISVLEAVKNSYNSYTVDSLSNEIGAASVLDDEYFKATVQKVIKTRERVKNELLAMGFSVLNSETNFLMVTKNGSSMKDLFLYLRSKQIFIRYFDLPRINNYVRISIGTDDEMELLLKEVRRYLDK